MKKNPFPNGCQNPDKSNCHYKNHPSSFDSSDNFCQICGAPLEEKNRRAFPWLWLGIAAGVLLLGFAAWKYFSHQPPPPPPPVITEIDDPCLSETPTRKNVLDEIRRRGEVRVVVESNAPPFNYEEQGQPMGFDYEIAKAIAEKLGVHRVKMVYASADDYGIFPCYFNRGEADWFMGGYLANSDFDNLVSWTDSYYDKNGYSLIIKRGSGIRSQRDLAGKKIAVYDEDEAVEWVKAHGGIPKRCIDTTDNGDWIQRELDVYGMDAIVYDYPFAVSEISELDPDCLKFKFVEFNLNTIPYVIGIPKGNDDMLIEMNKAIREIMADEPRYRKMVELIPVFKDCNPDVTPPPDPAKSHIVVSGETLSGIARDELGDINKWPDLWEWNKAHIPNPHLIQPGDVILLSAPE